MKKKHMLSSKLQNFINGLLLSVAGASTRVGKTALAVTKLLTSTNRYLFREMTMEDYFCDYVHALASFRGLQFEDVEDLTQKLIFLSENR